MPVTWARSEQNPSRLPAGLARAEARIHLVFVSGSELFKRDLFSAEALAERCAFPALFERLNPGCVQEALVASGKASMRSPPSPRGSVAPLVVGVAPHRLHKTGELHGAALKSRTLAERETSPTSAAD